uniref:Uncharacterized protein n=1 Tax=Anguilla anguilla TaxID=7936 RepID=A0A0E9PNF8_ANGAN
MFWELTMRWMSNTRNSHKNRG